MIYTLFPVHPDGFTSFVYSQEGGVDIDVVIVILRVDFAAVEKLALFVVPVEMLWCISCSIR
jgi:hypothetical protein